MKIKRWRKIHVQCIPNRVDTLPVELFLCYVYLLPLRHILNKIVKFNIQCKILMFSGGDIMCQPQVCGVPSLYEGTKFSRFIEKTYNPSDDRTDNMAAARRNGSHFKSASLYQHERLSLCLEPILIFFP